MDTATLALVGVVIVVAALLSGLVERTRFPQVALFLLLGLAIGPSGFALVDFRLDSAVLETIATLGLVLVLFTDAVAVDVAEVKRHRALVRLVLGPGTLITAALVAGAAWLLLGLAPGPAAILGAALASTDPVMMRGLVRGEHVPGAARQVLSLESGLNDLVLLPIVLAAMAILDGKATGTWGRAALNLFVVGPGAGVAVGFVGVVVLDRVRRSLGVRRDYESLYALGLAFTAYAVAEAAHGSGFLAAFAAGLTIAAVDAELCDCFLDFGQAAAEMFLLFTFVAFGASLIWSGLAGVTWRGVAFAAVALGLRSAVLAAALPRTGGGLDPRSRRLIVWFGPRGLSTLLLVLLPVFAGLPDADRLFAPAALVVLLSIAVHGGALMRWRKPGARTPPPPEAAPAGTPPVARQERITLAELKALQAAGERVVLLDVRKRGAWDESDQKAGGAIRLPPDGAAERAAELALPRHDWLVAYCA
jgi:NhaP-type Na+/H+ or K+/H+ antiporter